MDLVPTDSLERGLEQELGELNDRLKTRVVKSPSCAQVESPVANTERTIIASGQFRGKEERSSDRRFCGSPDISAPCDVEHHGTKVISFESFMMGASRDHQFDCEDTSVQSLVMDVGRPLCSTSSFLPCAAELNVSGHIQDIRYNSRFQDTFSGITGEVRT